MTNILIDIRYLETPHTGIAVGLKSFLDELKMSQPSGMNFYLIYNDINIYKDSDYYKSIQMKNKLFSIKEHFELYLILKKYNIDIFYSHHFVSPIFKPKKLKVVNIIHDLIPLKVSNTLSFIGERYYYFMNYITINHSSKIIANSYATKKDIENIFKRKNVEVVYHSYNIKKLSMYKDTILDNLNLNKQKYFLFVSSLKKHKNYRNIIKSFNLFNQDKDYKLVLVGKQEDNLVSDKDIIFTNYIDDDELNSLYKYSCALLFVSFVEGFGVPILEAQYHNCPVITSNISSMPEIAGDGALLVNPNNIDEIVGAMKKVLDNDFKNKLIFKGIKNIQNFSWEKYTNSIIKIFKGLR